MKKSVLALTIASATLMSGQASAFRIDTGSSSDWDVRWDTTLKYNLASRTESPDSDVTNLPITSAGDYSKTRQNGGIVSNRMDILTEADFVWKDSFGFRVSAAGWYDHAYKDNDRQTYNKHQDGTGFASEFWHNSYSAKQGEWTNNVDKYHHKGGELLDAFVFANFDISDDVGIGIRAGRHTIYWGQSLLLSGAIHGVASSMASIDAIKALSVAGSEAKELFMPSNKISTSIQIGQNVTVSAFYGLEFVPMRRPEDGTFYSPVDGFSDNGELLPFGPAVVGAIPGAYLGANGGGGYRITDSEAHNYHDWGVNISYYSEALDADLSAFYVSYQDKLPHGAIGAYYTSAVPGNEDMSYLLRKADGSDYDVTGEFKWTYKENIEVFGISASKEWADISWGVELNYRPNAPMNIDLVAALTGLNNEASAAGDNSGDVQGGPGMVNVSECDNSNYCGGVADMTSFILNGVGLLNENAIWDGGAWIVEWTASQWGDAHENGFRMIKSEMNEWEVAHTIGVRFNPTWYQVWSGVDLTAKFSAAYALDNISSMVFAGIEEQGTASAGVEARIDETYTVAMTYTNRFGPVPQGLGGRLKDKDTVGFSFKRTF